MEKINENMKTMMGRIRRKVDSLVQTGRDKGGTCSWQGLSSCVIVKVSVENRKRSRVTAECKRLKTDS